MTNLMTSMHKQLLEYDNDFDAFSSNDFTISLETFLVFMILLIGWTDWSFVVLCVSYLLLLVGKKTDKTREVISCLDVGILREASVLI